MNLGRKSWSSSMGGRESLVLADPVSATGDMPNLVWCCWLATAEAAAR